MVFYLCVKVLSNFKLDPVHVVISVLACIRETSGT